MMLAMLASMIAAQRAPLLWRQELATGRLFVTCNTSCSDWQPVTRLQQTWRIASVSLIETVAYIIYYNDGKSFLRIAKPGCPAKDSKLPDGTTQVVAEQPPETVWLLTKNGDCIPFIYGRRPAPLSEEQSGWAELRAGKAKNLVIRSEAVMEVSAVSIFSLVKMRKGGFKSIMLAGFTDVLDATADGGVIFAISKSGEWFSQHGGDVGVVSLPWKSGATSACILSPQRLFAIHHGVCSEWLRDTKKSRVLPINNPTVQWTDIRCINGVSVAIGQKASTWAIATSASLVKWSTVSQEYDKSRWEIGFVSGTAK